MKVSFLAPLLWAVLVLWGYTGCSRVRDEGDVPAVRTMWKGRPMKWKYYSKYNGVHRLSKSSLGKRQYKYSHSMLSHISKPDENEVHVERKKSVGSAHKIKLHHKKITKVHHIPNISERNAADEKQSKSQVGSTRESIKHTKIINRLQKIPQIIQPIDINDVEKIGGNDRNVKAEAARRQYEQSKHVVIVKSDSEHGPKKPTSSLMRTILTHNIPQNNLYKLHNDDIKGYHFKGYLTKDPHQHHHQHHYNRIQYSTTRPYKHVTTRSVKYRNVFADIMAMSRGEDTSSPEYKQKKIQTILDFIVKPLPLVNGQYKDPAADTAASDVPGKASNSEVVASKDVSLFPSEMKTQATIGGGAQDTSQTGNETQTTLTPQQVQADGQSPTTSSPDVQGASRDQSLVTSSRQTQKDSVDPSKDTRTSNGGSKDSNNSNKSNSAGSTLTTASVPAISQREIDRMKKYIDKVKKIQTARQQKSTLANGTNASVQEGRRNRNDNKQGTNQPQIQRHPSQQSQKEHPSNGSSSKPQPLNQVSMRRSNQEQQTSQVPRAYPPSSNNEAASSSTRGSTRTSSSPVQRSRQQQSTQTTPNQGPGQQQQITQTPSNRRPDQKQQSTQTTSTDAKTQQSTQTTPNQGPGQQQQITQTTSNRRPDQKQQSTQTTSNRKRSQQQPNTSKPVTSDTKTQRSTQTPLSRRHIQQQERTQTPSNRRPIQQQQNTQTPSNRRPIQQQQSTQTTSNRRSDQTQQSTQTTSNRRPGQKQPNTSKPVTPDAKTQRSTQTTSNRRPGQQQQSTRTTSNRRPSQKQPNTSKPVAPDAKTQRSATTRQGNQQQITRTATRNRPQDSTKTPTNRRRQINQAVPIKTLTPPKQRATNSNNPSEVKRTINNNRPDRQRNEQQRRTPTGQTANNPGTQQAPSNKTPRQNQPTAGSARQASDKQVTSHNPRSQSRTTTRQGSSERKRPAPTQQTAKQQPLTNSGRNQGISTTRQPSRNPNTLSSIQRPNEYPMRRTSNRPREPTSARQNVRRNQPAVRRPRTQTNIQTSNIANKPMNVKPRVHGRSGTPDPNQRRPGGQRIVHRFSRKPTVLMGSG